MAEDPPRRISRRALLKGVGLAGAAAVVPGGLEAAVSEGRIAPAASLPPQPGHPARVVDGPLQHLTAEEGRILDAMVARLIPSDELGPGAREAGALRYIDRELGGALAGSRESYRTGLAALDRYARYSRGASFVELSEADQDSLLIDVQSGSAMGAGAGFVGSSGSFFNMVKSHTWQATFSDPYYGGNQGYVGWSLLGYPGARRVVSESDQERMEAGELPPDYRSMYEG